VAASIDLNNSRAVPVIAQAPARMVPRDDEGRKDDRRRDEQYGRAEGRHGRDEERQRAEERRN